MANSLDRTPRRIEDAPSGLAHVMRQLDAVFYEEHGAEYIIHAPRRTRSGRPDHRTYEGYRIGRDKIALMSGQLDLGMPPAEFRAERLRGPQRSNRKRGGTGK